MTTRKDFLENRRKGIGGSDCAPILGLSKWSTPLDVYLSKVEPVKDEGDVPDYLHFGNVLEPVIADEFQRRTGMRVERRNQMYVDTNEPCLMANIDRYVVGERAILECKTANEYVKGEWGESETDEVPDEYLCQCLHYMSVTGYHKCYLAVLIGGNKFRWYVIPWREKLAAHLRERCVSFWHDHVLQRNPPPAASADDLVKLYGAGGLEAIKAEDRIVALCEELKMVKQTEKKATARKEELELEIKKFIGAHDGLVDPDTGKVLATWKACTSTRIDTKALKEIEPSIYAKYSTETTSRRFLLK